MGSAHVGDGFRALHAMKDKGKIASSSPCSALKTAYNECFNRMYYSEYVSQGDGGLGAEQYSLVLLSSTGMHWTWYKQEL